ncbi:MAG: alpha/beta hydrolase fold domain-containing protein [Opitutaceae bacterium]
MMQRLPLIAHSLIAAVSCVLLSTARAATKEELPAPDFANVSYGKHARNVFDLWLPKTAKPAPLVLFIHGGGFKGGDKRAFSPATLSQYREAGWALAAINYRLTDTAPAPAAYLDCARALQHLRHHAREWRLDPRRVAATGGSAGAGTSLWLAFHDDLADPKNADPIARESTRLTCVAVTNAQSSYDPRFAAKIGIPRPNFERHDFFLPFYGITKAEIDTPKAYERYEMAAPITYLTKDDPPVQLRYGHRNETVTDKTSLGVIVHHPLFGIALKREMDKLGIECVVIYRGTGADELLQEPPARGGRVVGTMDFIRKHFEAVR